MLGTLSTVLLHANMRSRAHWSGRCCALTPPPRITLSSGQDNYLPICPSTSKPLQWMTSDTGRYTSHGTTNAISPDASRTTRTTITRTHKPGPSLGSLQFFNKSLDGHKTSLISLDRYNLWVGPYPNSTTSITFTLKLSCHDMQVFGSVDWRPNLSTHFAYG